MFLKRISVSGFKSFADKVDFDFGPGVTCIVGPNGCGKSNVVDAFKWVLGEQSVRSLRGRQMTDMIFNGSSTRRGSSVAQVDLVFDNNDRSLPLDQTEVTVSRKLYRSGESEYLLNHDAARLKDIRELFMDTGVGVESYSVVEQGRVDSLLQSNPVDRRAIFEEAAGISKYKARRKEAERKLERTQQNLLRVADVIEELEKRLRSVKLQAGKARSYKQLEGRLNELRSSYALAEYHRFTRETDRLARMAQELSDQATSLRTEIGGHETDETQLKFRLDQLAETINAADSEFIQTKSELLAQEERIEAARRRVEEQQSSLQRAVARLAVNSQRFADTGRELGEVRGSAAGLRQQTQDLQARLHSLQEHDRGLARELTDAQASLEDEKTGIIDLLRRSAQVHNEITRLNTHRESLLGQKGRLSERDAAVTLELENALEQKVRLELRLRELDALLSEQNTTLEARITDAARVNQMCRQLTDELTQAREERGALCSRREILEELERRREGVGPAVRHLLDKKQSAEAPAGLEGLAGIVADLIDTDVAHARVIEAALAEASEHLVFRSSRAFVEHVETFTDLPGPMTAICLDRVPPLIHQRDFSDRPGFVARGIEWVRYADEFEQLARHLLSKTIVTADLPSALSMASEDVTGHRFVTLAGEVVEPDGRVRLQASSFGAGLVSRRSELREIEARLGRIVGGIETLSDQLNRTQAEIAHLETVRRHLQSAAYESGTAKAEVSTGLQNTLETVRRLTQEKPIIAHEVAMIEQQINEILSKTQDGGRSLEALENENREREQAAEAHRERIDATVARRRQVQDEVTQTRVAVGQLTEKRTSAAHQLRSLRRTLAELGSATEQAGHDVAHCEKHIAEAHAAIARGVDELDGFRHRVVELEAACTRLRKDREQFRVESENLSANVKQARTRLETVESESHQIQMGLTEARIRRDDLATRVRDELHIDLAERFPGYTPEEQDWAKVEAEITEVRQKLERLGNVNLDAIVELEELETRHHFLTGQRDDLASSQRQLEQLIGRLNDESKERFRKAFDEIRENFRAMFRKLFGGGRADIILEEPENLLECGIEILAQPPGKELQTISLMSGGEKSLTAIALLMSIFKSRPAPFAIMDEVDAALDEANNERFNRIVKEFVEGTQFIVITHSRWTMNIADQLYGITMQEAGVSTRVGVELSKAHVA